MCLTSSLYSSLDWISMDLCSSLTSFLWFSPSSSEIRLACSSSCLSLAVTFSPIWSFSCRSSSSATTLARSSANGILSKLVCFCLIPFEITFGVLQFLLQSCDRLFLLFLSLLRLFIRFIEEPLDFFDLFGQWGDFLLGFADLLLQLRSFFGVGDCLFLAASFFKDSIFLSRASICFFKSLISSLKELVSSFEASCSSFQPSTSCFNDSFSLTRPSFSFSRPSFLTLNSSFSSSSFVTICEKCSTWPCIMLISTVPELDEFEEYLSPGKESISKYKENVNLWHIVVTRVFLIIWTVLRVKPSVWPLTSPRRQRWGFLLQKYWKKNTEWDAWGFAASCWNPTGTSFWRARPFLPTQLSSLRVQLGKRYLAQGHPPIENPPYWNDTYYKKCSVQKVTLPNRDGSKFTIPNLICWTWNEIKKGTEQKSRFKSGTDLHN